MRKGGKGREGRDGGYLDSFCTHVFVHGEECLLVLFARDFKQRDAPDLGHFFAIA